MSVNFDLLKTLCETPGVPSQEDQIRAVVSRELATMTDSQETDRMGNVIAQKKGSGGPRVMIAAHLDEIGFIVRHIDDRGFLSLQPVGGFDPRQLCSQRMIVHGFAGESLRGAMAYGAKPTHLLTPEEAKAGMKLENFFVDLGLSADAVNEKVRVGDMVTLDRTCERVGDCVMSKSLDNRIGVFVMLEAVRKLGSHQAEIFPVATVQEEVGLRGATTAAYQVEPDIGIALDVTLAVDQPGIGAADRITSLGDGAAIKIMDGSLICHPKLVDHFRSVAVEREIKHQMEVLPRGGTDAGALQRSRGGVPSITLSVPCRYVHTVNEMVNLADLENAIDLLAAYLEAAHEGDYSY